MATGGSGQDASTNVLSVEDLGDLIEELVDVAPKWRPFGLRLGLPVSFLEGLAHKDDQLFDVLLKWLQNAVPPRKPATWVTIVHALESRSVGLAWLARTLEKKHIGPSVQHDGRETQTPALQHQSQSLPAASNAPTTTVERSHSDSTNTSTIGRHSPLAVSKPEIGMERRQAPSVSGSSDEPPVSPDSLVSTDFGRQTQQPPSPSAVKRKPRHKSYGCGCGKCSLEMYLKGGCPNPVETTSRFPYLDTKGLKKPEVELLIGRLESESLDMVFRFQGLVSDTCLSFCNQNISPQELTTHLKSLGTLKHIHTSNAAYFRDRFQELESAPDVNVVFTIAQEYMSFFNPGIIEHLIEKLGTSKDGERLQMYQQQLETYCRRRVVECPCEFADPSDGARVVIKKDEQLEQFTMAGLRNFQSRVLRLLQLHRHTLLLCTVEEGCLQMTYHVPASVADRVFPLSDEQHTQLEHEGVLVLSCGNYRYDKRCSPGLEPKPIVIEKTAKAHPKPARKDPSRIQCTNYMLLKHCRFGEKCRYLHDRQADRVYTGYVDIPEHIPVGMVVGKSQTRLSDVKASFECTIEVVRRQDVERNIQQLKVLAADEEQLEGAMQHLQLYITKIYTNAPQWTYFHIGGVTEDLQLFFHEYTGRRPPSMKQKRLRLYEVCRVERPTAIPSATPFTEPHPLDPDSETRVQAVLDTLHGTQAQQQLSAEEVASALKSNKPRSASDNQQWTLFHRGQKIMLNYQDQIKLRLREALEWFQHNRKPKQVAKIEVRLGKKVWFYLPRREASAERMDVGKFEEFLFCDTNYLTLFQPNVRSASADNLCRHLDATYSVQTTFDLKFATTPTDTDRGGVKYSARVKADRGKPKVTIVKKDSSNVALFDVICLHRLHDVRFALCQFQVVEDQESEVADNLLQTVSFPEPNVIRLIPTGDNWSLHLIRHRRSRIYVFKGKYTVAVTTVTEYYVDYAKIPKGEIITVNIEDQREQHIEVELNNIAWESVFGRDIGWSPQEALSVYMDDPMLPQGDTESVPHPWEPETILKGLNEFMDQADHINTFLGLV